MQWSLVAVLVATVAGTWADECSPPTPGEKIAKPWECCKLKNFLMDGKLAESIKKCTAKYPITKQSGPPGQPSTEMKNAFACSSECVFEDNKLLTADKQVDKAAFTKMMSSVDVDKEQAAVLAKAVDSCLSSYTADMDKTLECKSGAVALERCLMKQVFLDCPKGAWTDSSECKALKTKMTNCPNMMPMLLKPHDH